MSSTPTLEEEEEEEIIQITDFACQESESIAEVVSEDDLGEPLPKVICAPHIEQQQQPCERQMESPLVAEVNEWEKLSDDEITKMINQHYHSALKLMSRDEKEKVLTIFMQAQSRNEKRPGRKESKRHKGPGELHNKK